MPVAAQPQQQSSQRVRISVLSPSKESPVRFNSIIAQITPGIKKIERVTVSLKRINPSSQLTQFWTGKEWTKGIGGQLEQPMYLNEDKWTFNTQGAFPTTDEYKYEMKIGAVDESSHVSYVNRAFVINWSPTVIIDFPRKGLTVSSITQPDLVQGIIKTPTETRLQFVHIFLYRHNFEGGIEYWNGREWQGSIPSAIPATIQEERPNSSNHNVNRWRWDRQLPTGEQLRDGNYRLEVVAINQGGQKALSTVTFVVANAPILKIQSPSSGTKISSSLEFTGTLSMPTPTSAEFVGEIRIELSKYKLWPVAYWNGQQWTKQPATLPATFQSRNQGSSSKMWYLKDVPSFPQLEDGTYRAVVWAYKGNTPVSAAGTFFKVDRGPQVTIISSLMSGKQKRGKNLPTVQGKVAVGLGKGSVKKVSLSLSRLPMGGIGGEVWTGRKWVKAPSAASLNLVAVQEQSGGISWTWAKDFPPAYSIIPGVYYLTIWAIDSHGKSGARTIPFGVQ